MAVDQRSGGKVNGVDNETHRRATRMGLERELFGCLRRYGGGACVYARKELAAERIIVWGSSYSASLVLRLAAEHADEVIVGVMAFSPGEYFKKEGSRLHSERSPGARDAARLRHVLERRNVTRCGRSSTPHRLRRRSSSPPHRKVSTGPARCGTSGRTATSTGPRSMGSSESTRPPHHQQQTEPIGTAA